jgi:acyl-coenzyme A thioesterase PaaI-like protein
VPEGFERHTRRSGLTDPWEPIYARRSTRGVSLAIRAGTAHANSRGFVHGGLITALADNAMGLSCGEQAANTASLVTVSLSVDFVGFAKVGQWIERPHASVSVTLRSSGRGRICPHDRKLAHVVTTASHASQTS